MDRDESSHWYIVRADKRDEWEAWVELDEDDENSWEEPWFAYRIGGSPTQVEFENPICWGKAVEL